jgi:hypothetical protein
LSHPAFERIASNWVRPGDLREVDGSPAQLRDAVLAAQTVQHIFSSAEYRLRVARRMSYVVPHRPANNIPGAKIEHGRQVEPAFTGWHAGNIGELDLIGPFDSEIAVEPPSGVHPALARLLGALLHVSGPIDDLQVRDAPEGQQCRPLSIAIVVPDLEQGNVVIDLGILEHPFAGCETAALLKNFQVPDMTARRNP